MKYLERKEVMAKINLLENSQDKFIIAGIFSGLTTQGTTEFCKIKKSDIDTDNLTIKVGSKLVKVSKEIMDITLAAMNQKIYYPLNVKGGTTKSYELNLDSEYIIKTKPNKNSGEGKTPITADGLKNRIRNLTNFLGWNGVNSRILKQSGAYATLIEADRLWTINTDYEYLKPKGYNMKYNNVVEMVSNTKKL